MTKKHDTQTTDLFPVDPEIRGFGIQEFKIKEGSVTAILTGVTLVSDIALINDDTWRKAVSEWLVSLCGNGDIIQGYIDDARFRAYEGEKDRQAMQEAMSRTKSMPPWVAGLAQAESKN